MAFTILDNDEVFNVNQAIWMQTDINALVAGFGGDGVVSGCAVTAQGSPDMTLAVASGTINIAGAAVAVASGNVTITAADVTNPRIDLVVVSNAGVKSVTAGTAAANPKAPDIPANSVLLAMVYVPANDLAIEAGQITDKRVISVARLSGGGTLALGGFTLTVPATGTAALLATGNVFSAAQAIAVADAVTSTTTTLATFTHNSSGTPAASFGSRLLFNLDSATVDDRNAAAMDVTWTDATDGSRSSQIVLSPVLNGSITAKLTITTSQIIAAGTLKCSTSFAAEMPNSAGNAGTPNFSFSSDGDTGMYRVGANTLGFTTNAVQKVNIGSDGATWIKGSDAGTNAVLGVLTVGHNSSGTPVAGYGTSLIVQGQSSTTVDTTMADQQVSWVVPTHASRTARVVHNVYDTAAREGLRIEASGSAPMIGFLGAAAVVRQTGGENLTNNVTSGGTDGTIANYTDLSVYANDAAAIRNDIYQLARAVKQSRDALRLYGLLT